MRTVKPRDYWSRPVDEVLRSLDTRNDGLSADEERGRLKAYGRNALTVRSDASPSRILLRQFTNPLVLILLFAVVVSVLAGEWTDAAVILAIVVGTAAITFFQERSAADAISRLRKRLVHNVTVLRDGKPAMVDAETVVPGDVVLLSAGSLVPADGLVLEADGLFVNQAALTGETFPVEKRSGTVQAAAGLTDRVNCVFMGTSVRSGVGRFVVVDTGLRAEYGRIAEKLARSEPETDFDRGIRQFGLLLSRIMITLVLVVFAVNVLSAKPPIDSLLFAIALAVGISPELLPAIITINLSKGARKMARGGVIVRRLDAIENLGSMDVLCTDKTGTLTEGVVRLDASLDANAKSSDAVFRLAYINASLQSGLANPLDAAITARDPPDLSDVEKLSEIPYDFARKRLGVVVRDRDHGDLLIVKGALDSVLDACTFVRGGTRVLTIDDAARNGFDNRLRDWSSKGYRVLGVASKPVPGHIRPSREAEQELVFEGFLLFFDPPKEDAAAAIEGLKRLNVRLAMITGDNQYVARHVAETVGLPIDRIVTGRQLSEMSSEALRHTVERAAVFAEVDPDQKEQIVQALRRRGHVVGYMGDGINDAPSLQDADVGISVEGAVDVAREAADLVLLHKGLGILRNGIEEGRVTFANSLKYVFTTTSANFGNMFSMAGATLFLPFLPLLAKQILLNNFLSDIPAIAIAGDNVDREYIEQPPRWDNKFIRNFMLLFGSLSSLFDLLTFGLLIYVVRASEDEFRTGWFIESLLTELMVALAVRTRRPLFRSRPGRWLWISTLAVSVFALAVPYLPWANVFGFVPLPPGLLGMIILVSVSYIAATEVVKAWFYRSRR